MYILKEWKYWKNENVGLQRFYFFTIQSGLNSSDLNLGFQDWHITQKSFWQTESSLHWDMQCCTFLQFPNINNMVLYHHPHCILQYWIEGLTLWSAEYPAAHCRVTVDFKS